MIQSYCRATIKNNRRGLASAKTNDRACAASRHSPDVGHTSLSETRVAGYHARGAEAVWTVVLPTQYWAPRGSFVSPGVCAHCATTKRHHNYTTFCMLLCELIIQFTLLPRCTGVCSGAGRLWGFLPLE